MMKPILYIFCVLFLLNSCEIKVIEPVGKQGDTIKLSATKLSVGADGGMSTVTSEGKYWYISDYIPIDEKTYNLWAEEENGNPFLVCESNPLDTFGIIKIKSAWFTVTKETPQKLVFSIAPNPTGKNPDIGADYMG
jgi:hypothetical protein